MQTFVKIIVALLFTHMSVSDTVKVDRKEKKELQNTSIIKKSSCTSTNTWSQHPLI